MEKAFDDLKHALVSPPALVFPDFPTSFLVKTDTSAMTLKAVLS